MVSDSRPKLSSAQAAVLRALRDAPRIRRQFPQHFRREVPGLLDLKYIEEVKSTLRITDRGREALAEHDARPPDQVGTVDPVTGWQRRPSRLTEDLASTAKDSEPGASTKPPPASEVDRSAAERATRTSVNRATPTTHDIKQAGRTGGAAGGGVEPGRVW